MQIGKKSEQIETARGLACLLLVAYHVVGNHVSNGLNVSVDSPWRIATLIFEHLRMPLFSFLSGYVYAYRPAAPGQRKAFLGKKMLRLLIPFVIVSTLFFVFQGLAPGVNSPTDYSTLWRIYVFPYAHFWFLQAIAIVIVLAVVVEPLVRTWRNYAAFMLLLLFAHLWLRIPENVFAVRDALYLAPFFFLGMGANRFPDMLRGSLARMLALPALILLWGAYIAICISDPALAPEKSTPFGTALSIASCLVVVQRLPVYPALAWIGGFSFTIYLYHVFFTAAVRIALRAIGDFPLAVHVALGVSAGIAGPIVIEYVLRRSKIARRTLLGQS